VVAIKFVKLHHTTWLVDGVPKDALSLSKLKEEWRAPTIALAQTVQSYVMSMKKIEHGHQATTTMIANLSQLKSQMKRVRLIGQSQLKHGMHW
jgi:hypothetical protein